MAPLLCAGHAAHRSGARPAWGSGDDWTCTISAASATSRAPRLIAAPCRAILSSSQRDGRGCCSSGQIPSFQAAVKNTGGRDGPDLLRQTCRCPSLRFKRKFCRLGAPVASPRCAALPASQHRAALPLAARGLLLLLAAAASPPRCRRLTALPRFALPHLQACCVQCSSCAGASW